MASMYIRPHVNAALLGSVLMFATVGCTKDKCERTPHCLLGTYCDEGRCVSEAEDGSCTPRLSGRDGCDYESICARKLADEDATFACEKISDCEGALVNDDHTAEKDNRVCLRGYCRSDEHCFFDEVCLLSDSDDPLGVCSDGARGSYCLNAADCTDVTCTPIEEAGTLGICGRPL